MNKWIMTVIALISLLIGITGDRISLAAEISSHGTRIEDLERRVSIVESQNNQILKDLTDIDVQLGELKALTRTRIK
jgi:hypothetical protein